MLDGVIFDCDGVLVDSEPLANRALAATLTDWGIPFTPAESVREFMGRSWARVEAVVRERTGAPPAEGLREDYRERMFAAFEAELTAVPGVEEALSGLAGVPRCVASSGHPEKIRWTLGRTGLIRWFDEGHLFSAAEVEHGKPAPDLFLHAARRMGWAPERCVVIEDAPAGVAAGAAAGMRVLAYAALASEGELRDAGAAVVFTEMRRLPQLVGA